MLLVASKVFSRDKPVVGVNTDPERYELIMECFWKGGFMNKDKTWNKGIVVWNVL